MNRFIQWLKKPSSDRVLLVIILILLNLISARAFFRLDLTAQKAYSLSKASKDVVRHIEAPLSVKVFFSKNLSAPYSTVEQYLTDILTEYKANASGNFSYQFFDMTKDENQKIAHDLGLGPVQIDTVETSGFSSKIAWMGLAITYGDYIAAIDALQSTADLEYKITTTISKIISAQETKSESLYQIGYITGHNENKLRSNPYAQNYSETGSGNFRNILSDIYSIKEINLASESIPQDLKAIIINGPKTEFSHEELYMIDQYIMNGGNVLFFVDPLTEYVPDQNSYPVYLETKTGIENLLAGYGINLQPYYVMDEKCFSQNQRGYGKQDLNWAPVVEKDNTPKKNAITDNLGGLIFFCNGPIDIFTAQENHDVKTTVLAKSSKNSWIINEGFILYPGYIVPPSDRSTMKSENLAVLLEGKFKSAFPDGAYDFKSESAVSSRIIVVSSSLITTDALIDKDGREPIAMFVRNAVDYVNNNEDFCTMRTKGTRLDFISIRNEKSAVIVKLLNEFGLAVVVILIGFIVWRVRLTRRYFIHNKYNPDDSRIAAKGEKK